MRRITTTVDIDAPAAAIWQALVDFPVYPDWNPFIRRIEGEARAGAKLKVTVQPPGRRPMSFRPSVLVADPGRELRWRGRFLMPGILDGEHAFIIEERGDGCRMRHEEVFSGVLVPAFGGMFEDTARGFAALNAALKRRVEAGRWPRIIGDSSIGPP